MAYTSRSHGSEACSAPCGPGIYFTAAGVGGGRATLPMAALCTAQVLSAAGNLGEDDVELDVQCDSDLAPPFGIQWPILETG